MESFHEKKGIETGPFIILFCFSEELDSTILKGNFRFEKILISANAASIRVLKGASSKI